jgi:hypothetical protein
MISTLRHRVHKLEGVRRSDPDDCRGGPTVLVDAGEPVPADSPRRRQCGWPHVMRVEEEVLPAATAG